MKINSKNIALMLLMFFLISNQIIGMAWSLFKTFIYCSLFLYVLKQVSPDMYIYFMKLFNLNEFRISNIPSSLISILKKLKSFIPIFNDKKDKENKINSESS